MPHLAPLVLARENNYLCTVDAQCKQCEYARMKKTNTLQIRAFPYEVNKALKVQSVNLGITFREHIVAILSDYALKAAVKRGQA